MPKTPHWFRAGYQYQLTMCRASIVLPIRVFAFQGDDNDRDAQHVAHDARAIMAGVKLRNRVSGRGGQAIAELTVDNLCFSRPRTTVRVRHSPMPSSAGSTSCRALSNPARTIGCLSPLCRSGLLGRAPSTARHLMARALAGDPEPPILFSGAAVNNPSYTLSVAQCWARASNTNSSPTARPRSGII